MYGEQRTAPRSHDRGAVRCLKKSQAVERTTEFLVNFAPHLFAGNLLVAADAEIMVGAKSAVILHPKTVLLNVVAHLSPVGIFLVDDAQFFAPVKIVGGFKITAAGDLLQLFGI